MVLLILIFVLLIFFILVKKCISYTNISNKYKPIIHEFIKLESSNIHGNGLFPKKEYQKDEYVFTAIDKRIITPIGTKINHSWTPNTYLKQNYLKYDIHAKKNININEELTLDYRDTPSFIAKPGKNYV